MYVLLNFMLCPIIYSSKQTVQLAKTLAASYMLASGPVHRNYMLGP